MIVFAGTVGAGKSTQIRLVKSKINNAGFKVNSTFLKSGHVFAYVFESVLTKILFKKDKGWTKNKAEEWLVSHKYEFEPMEA